MRTTEWLAKSRNRVFLDMHFPDWDGKGICSNFDTDDIVETFSRSHVDSVILYAKCQYGNFYYNAKKLGHKHSGLGEQDLFNELTQKAHEKGIKVIAYYSVSWDEHVSARHPEWLVTGPDGIKDNLDEYRWSTLCINSPYRMLVFEHLREIAAATGTDGFWLDMTIIGKNRCHCSFCKEKFFNRYGMHIPKDNTVAGWDTFQKWRYDYIEEFYSQAIDVIKSVDENIVVANNYWGYPYQSGSMGSRAVGALKRADFSTGEAYTDWTGLNAPGIFSKYLRGAGNNKPFEVLIGRFYNTWDYTVKSKNQLAYEAYTVIANGGTVTLDDEPYHDGTLEKETYEYLKDIFNVINVRSEALNGAVPVKYAAILHSQATKDYLNNYGEASFIPPIAGAYKVFRDLHIPIGFLFDESLTEDTLTGYKVLILPDVGCLSTEHCGVIRNFVAGGGTLISTYKTSLYDQCGVMRDDYGLKDVMGLNFEGFSNYTLSYFKLKEEPSWENINIRRPYGFNGGYIKANVGGDAKAAAYIVDPICETDGKTFFHNNLPAPHSKTLFPAIVTNKYGEGHSIYFASEIFSAFARKGQREVKNIIRSLLGNRAPRLPVKVECPSSVEVVVNTIGDHKLVVHLINPHMDLPVCYGHMEVFNGYYDRTLECIEDIVKLYNVKASIEIPNGRGVKSVKAFEGPGIEGFSIDGGYCTFTIPEINLWQTILIEFK